MAPVLYGESDKMKLLPGAKVLTAREIWSSTEQGQEERRLRLWAGQLSGKQSKRSVLGLGTGHMSQPKHVAVIHPICRLSYDRSTSPSSASSPQTAI
jgi:hypothetical protein